MRLVPHHPLAEARWEGEVAYLLDKLLWRKQTLCQHGWEDASYITTRE